MPNRIKFKRHEGKRLSKLCKSDRNGLSANARVGAKSFVGLAGAPFLTKFYGIGAAHIEKCFAEL